MLKSRTFNFTGSTAGADRSIRADESDEEHRFLNATKHDQAEYLDGGTASTNNSPKDEARAAHKTGVHSDVTKTIEAEKIADLMAKETHEAMRKLTDMLDDVVSNRERIERRIGEAEAEAAMLRHSMSNTKAEDMFGSDTSGPDVDIAKGVPSEEKESC